MSKHNAYARAKNFFEQLDIGQSISARELGHGIGAATYEERKKVAAFLSHLARKGRARKYVGEDKRMYYVKLAPTPSKVAPVKDRNEDTINLGEIGERIVNYIEKLRGRIAKLEKERDKLKAKLLIRSRQKEEFKQLYQEAEKKIKDLSTKQPVARKTIRLSKTLEN